MRRFLLLLVLAAVALAIQAPAWLAGVALERRSGGMVRLTQPVGTLWNGGADLVVPARSTAEREIFVTRLAWRLERIDWGRRALIFAVSQAPPAPRPATVALGPDGLRIAGSVRLPAAVAGRIPQLATWTIAGDATIATDALDLADGGGQGVALLHWRGAALTPPDLPGGFALGEVTARIALEGAAAGITMTNAGGDVELAGEASSRTGAVGLTLQPRPGTPPALAAWLQSHTMGRKPRGYAIDFRWPGR